MPVDDYKTVNTTKVLELIENSTKLARVTISDPRYARQAADLISAILGATEALSEAKAARILVEVPENIQQRLEEIYNLLKTNEREVAKLQGIILARSQLPQNAQQLSNSRADIRRNGTPSGATPQNEYQMLLDMVKNLAGK